MALCLRRHVTYGTRVLHPYGMTPYGFATWPTAPPRTCLDAPQQQLSITATALSPEEQAFISTLNEVRVGAAPCEGRTAVLLGGRIRVHGNMCCSLSAPSLLLYGLKARAARLMVLTRGPAPLRSCMQGSPTR